MTLIVQERWLREQLRPVRESIAANIVVLDPDELLDNEMVADGRRLIRASNWLELRRAYENNDRGRSANAERQVIHVVSADLATGRDLPWDIEQHSDVAVVRWPHHRRWLPWRRHLDPGRAARLTELVEREPTVTVRNVLAELFGVTLPTTDPATELAVVTELRRRSFPAELWPDVEALVQGEEARGLAHDPPEASALQAAWASWLHDGRSTRAAALLEPNPGPVISLLQSGLLLPEPVEADGLPEWARLGERNITPRHRAELLLENAPAGAPTDPEGWFAYARWWGELRATLSAVAPQAQALADRAFEGWEIADAEFRDWLRANYGLLLTSTRSHPVTVDKIAPFLARRLRGGTRRIMLIVLDGLGMAQWHDLRTRCGLEVVEAGACFAMLPTLTPHSRQAIFAGAPPLAFAGDLENNRAEERRWRGFWVAEGLQAGEVGYHHDRGADASAVPVLGNERVYGVVGLAIDQMLHEAKVLPDPQLAAAVRTWADHGFLAELVERATADGFEVWLTSDHGNVEALPLGLLQEGDAVDAPGRRARFYLNATLRDRAAERSRGDAWDPPGYPADGRNLLFARGRGAWMLGGTQVVHGGLSVDEVIVPFVRVQR